MSAKAGALCGGEDGSSDAKGFKRNNNIWLTEAQLELAVGYGNRTRKNNWLGSTSDGTV